jgi:hypothetical protein
MSISQNFPEVYPSLTLDFANSKTLDPRITFTRSSTGTYVGADGLIKTASADEPRFDHDPVTGESLGLLIEESRTNYYTTSETLTNSRTGSSSGMIYTDFTTDGPQGGRFTRVVRNTSLSRTLDWDWQIVYSNLGLSIGQQFAVTFYARCPNGTLASIKLSNPDAEGQIFNIDTTWRRFTKVFTYGVQGELTFFRFNRSHTPAYVNGATYDLAALQIERVSSATSYIPTSGSTVTRQPDIAKITGTNFTDFYNQSKGTIFTSFRPLPLSTGSRYVQSSTIGSTLETFYIRSTPTGSDSAIIDGGVAQAYNLINYTRSEQENSKHAYAYELNNFGVSAQGQLGSGDTSCTMPTITRFDIGSLYQDSNTFLNGYISQLFYYPERLTNDQLQNLTK